MNNSEFCKILLILNKNSPLNESQRITLQKIIDSDENEEDKLCGACNGSGEGMYDGTVCSNCKGKGVEKK